MRKLMLGLLMVAFIGASTLQAQSPEYRRLEKRDRSEHRMHRKQHGENRTGKFAAGKHKKDDKKAFWKLKRMAKADGKITPNEKRLLRKERRQMRPR
jgi:Ni/Co efflux regulator RcnB